MQDTASGIFRPARDDRWPDRALVVHADRGWHDHILGGHCDFFEKIGRAARDRGLDTLLVRADRPGGNTLPDGPQTHILIGPKRLRGRQVFHAWPAYIKGFWYLDPRGYFWNSSILTTGFDPGAIDAEAAGAFFTRVSRHRIRRNVSQRRQAPPADLAPADVAVFTQDIERHAEPVHHLQTQQMIRAAANAVPGRVYVKPHPLMTEAQRAWLARLCGRLENAVLTDASVHDIIRASGVIVSQNSAVGFEALMHRKPVITCARTDYAGASLVSRTAGELRANIRRAPDHFATFPFEKYFYWFLGQNMLEPQRDDFTARAMAILFPA